MRLQGFLSDNNVAKLPVHLAQLLRNISFSSINSQVIKRAKGPFPTVIKSPDATHLATALCTKEDEVEDIVLLTFDKKLATAAQASGISVEEGLLD